MKKFECPVCGYPDMTRPPEHFNICVCCGTEFENDDDEVSHDELRARWIEAGALWFNTFAPPDRTWSAGLQLRKAGHAPTAMDLARIANRKADTIRSNMLAPAGARSLADFTVNINYGTDVNSTNLFAGSAATVGGLFPSISAMPVRA